MEALQKIFPADDFALLLLVIGMPLLGAFVNGVFGKRLGKDAVRLMALASAPKPPRTTRSRNLPPRKYRRNPCARCCSRWPAIRGSCSCASPFGG